MQVERRSYDTLINDDLDDQVFRMLSQIIDTHGFHQQLSLIERLGKAHFIKVFRKSSIALAEFYFQLGKLYFRRQVPQVRDESDSGSNESFEESFFNILTAASLGHKHSRAYLALFVENGLVPSS